MVRPCVASGFAELAVSGLASMYPAFDWSICSGPSWISARVRSHYRTGLDWTIWVTSVRMRREDRTSISSHPLADLGGCLRSSIYIRSCAPSFGDLPQLTISSLAVRESLYIFDKR